MSFDLLTHAASWWRRRDRVIMSHVYLISAIRSWNAAEHTMKDGIFFAYAHRDRDVATSVRTMLRQADFVLADFMDPTVSMAPPAMQSTFEINLKVLLDSSRLLIILWSHHARDSRWLEMEWRYFLASSDARVLTLRLDDTPLPPALMSFQSWRLSPDSTALAAHVDLIMKSLEGHVMKVDRQKIFISYSRQDAAVVNATLAELAGCPLHPYMDQEFVEDDDTFAEDIVGALRDSVGLCFMSTTHSNGSRHCAREVSLADKFGMPLALVPLEACKLSDKNVYFFATVPAREPNDKLCEYLRREIDRQRPHRQAA